MILTKRQPVSVGEMIVEEFMAMDGVAFSGANGKN